MALQTLRSFLLYVLWKNYAHGNRRYIRCYFVQSLLYEDNYSRIIIITVRNKLRRKI